MGQQRTRGKERDKKGKVGEGTDPLYFGTRIRPCLDDGDNIVAVAALVAMQNVHG